MPLKTGEENPACPFSAEEKPDEQPHNWGPWQKRGGPWGNPQIQPQMPSLPGKGRGLPGRQPGQGLAPCSPSRPKAARNPHGMDFARTAPLPCAPPADLEADEAFLPGMEARQVDLLKGFLAQPEIHPVRSDRELEGDRLVGFRHLAWEEELGQGSSPSCCFVLGGSHNSGGLSLLPPLPHSHPIDPGRKERQ